MNDPADSNQSSMDAPSGESDLLSNKMMAESHDSPHSDKYNDPRAAITRRGVLIGIGVVCFGVFGAALSIWARKTSLKQTRAFWGDDLITALQLAEEIELLLPTADDANQAPEPVRLSGMPGLGHLRHTLLDDRSYDWETAEQPEGSPANPETDPAPIKDSQMVLRLTDPTANRFSEIRIRLELEDGWVWLESQPNRVQLNSRFRKAVPSFLKRIANFEPMHLDARNRKRELSEASESHETPAEPSDPS